MIFQVLTGARRFANIEFQGDPELQPVRSFESEIAVTQLYKLSSSLNSKVSKRTEKHSPSLSAETETLDRVELVSPTIRLLPFVSLLVGAKNFTRYRV